MYNNVIEEGWREKQRQRSSRLFGGQNLLKILAPLAVLPRSLWKNEMNSTVSSKSTEAKQQAWQGIEQNLPPPNGRDDLCLYFSLHPSSSMIKPLFQSTFYISIYLLLCILHCKDYLSIMCCTLIECIYTNLLTYTWNTTNRSLV